jgi:hypothetical protein
MSGGITAAVIGGAALVYSANQSSRAAQSAAQMQADAADRASAQQAAATERQVELGEPYRVTGTAAMNRLAAMTEPGGRLTQDFGYDPFQYQADPGYAFRLKEGLNAMNASAAARGGLISGNALRAGQAYGQQMGSQEYGAAFNRYLQNYANAQNTFQMNRNNLVDPLKFLSSQGQAAAAGQAANIGQGAANTANLTTGAANAQAAGMIGSANAYTNAIGQGVSMYQTNQLLNRFAPQRTTPNFYGDRAAPVTDYSTPYEG